jgi:hypothetical protein
MGLRFPVFRRRFLKWTWIARGRERLEDGGIARKVTGFFFRRGAAGTAGGKWIRERGPALAGGEQPAQRCGTEFKRQPVASECERSDLSYRWGRRF